MKPGLILALSSFCTQSVLKLALMETMSLPELLSSFFSVVSVTVRVNNPEFYVDAAA